MNKPQKITKKQPFEKKTNISLFLRRNRKSWMDLNCGDALEFNKHIENC